MTSSGTRQAPKRRSRPCTKVRECFARAVRFVGRLRRPVHDQVPRRLLVGIHTVTAAEMVALAQPRRDRCRLGDRADREGAERSRMLELAAPPMATGDDATGATIDLYREALGLSAACASEVGAATALLNGSPNSTNVPCPAEMAARSWHPPTPPTSKTIAEGSPSGASVHLLKEHGRAIELGFAVRERASETARSAAWHASGKRRSTTLRPAQEGVRERAPDAEPTRAMDGGTEVPNAEP